MDPLLSCNDLNRSSNYYIIFKLTGSDCAVETANVFCQTLQGERFWWNDVDDVIKKIHDDKELFHRCDDVGYSWIAMCLNELFY